jgi:hypothetical protein
MKTTGKWTKMGSRRDLVCFYYYFFTNASLGDNYDYTNEDNGEVVCFYYYFFTNAYLGMIYADE